MVTAAEIAAVLVTTINLVTAIVNVVVRARLKRIFGRPWESATLFNAKKI